VCFENTDCKDTTKPVCDTKGDQPSCVQCVKDTDCPTTAPHCNNLVCGA
jgi:hypothetical protein